MGEDGKRVILTLRANVLTPRCRMFTVFFIVFGYKEFATLVGASDAFSEHITLVAENFAYWWEAHSLRAPSLSVTHAQTNTRRKDGVPFILSRPDKKPSCFEEKPTPFLIV